MKLRFCEICGRGFLSESRDKTCSDECRKEYKRWYKREYMREYMRTYKPKPKNPLLKIHPSKLPYRGEPTRAVRVETSEDRELRAMAEAKKRELDFKKRFQGRQKSASERSTIGWEKRADRWTPEKEAEILRMRSEGMGVEEIAKRIGRTPLAVDHKLRRLDGKE